MSANRQRVPAWSLNLLAVFVVASLFGSAPLGAQDDVASDRANAELRSAYDLAIDATLRETAFMQLSGAFGDVVPRPILQLPARILGDATEGDVADGFALVNGEQGPAALEELQRLDLELTPVVHAVLSSDPAPSLIGIPYAPYVRAHHDLVANRLAVDGESITPEHDVTGLLGVFTMLPAAGAGGPGLGNGQVLSSALQPEEPIDRGDPPDVLIQGDGESQTTSGASSTATVTALGLSLDPVEMLILAAVAVIVLSLVTLLVTNGQRSRGPSVIEDGEKQQFMAATRAIHSAASVEQLCRAAAFHARLLTGAKSASITIDGYEDTDGAEFDVPIELVFLANRTEELASDGELHAIPILHGNGQIIGLLVTLEGDTTTLRAFEPLVADGYTSVVAREETAALAFVDGLTGIANRRRFDNDLDLVIDLATETRASVAVAMFDVDDFKTFNDNNGHQAGDEVLRQVAELISLNLRSTDVVYRYGGEEFVALLPGATVEDAYDVVERIRQVVESAVFEGQSCQPGGTVTLSVGVAATPEGDGPSLVRAADMALYEAKTTGRNRVVIETQLT